MNNFKVKHPRGNLQFEIDFTRAHRAAVARFTHPARIEAACLRAQFPAILHPIEEGDLLAGWQRTMETRFAGLRLLDPQQPILPAMPPARQLVRGQWVSGTFPERFMPTFAALTRILFPKAQQDEGPDAAP